MPTYDSYMSQIAQARQDVGQRIAGMPQFQTNLSEAVYGKEQALPSLRTQASDKVKALYDLDKRAADRYANPTSNMFIKDPYAREKLMSTQHQNELGGIQDLNNLIAQRQDVLGNAMQKGLDIYKAGIDAQKFEYQSIMDELDAKIKIDAAKRAGASSGTKKGPYYTDLLELVKANAPTDIPKDPSQTITKNGFHYQFDPTSQSWASTEFGGLSQLDSAIQVLKLNPDLNSELGQSVYKTTALPPEVPNANARDMSRDQFISAVKQEIQNESVGMNADTTYRKLIENHGTELSAQDAKDLETYIYSLKGELKLGL